MQFRFATITRFIYVCFYIFLFRRITLHFDIKSCTLNRLHKNAYAFLSTTSTLAWVADELNPGLVRLQRRLHRHEFIALITTLKKKYAFEVLFHIFVAHCNAVITTNCIWKLSGLYFSPFINDISSRTRFNESRWRKLYYFFLPRRRISSINLSF